MTLPIKKNHRLVAQYYRPEAEVALNSVRRGPVVQRRSSRSYRFGFSGDYLGFNDIKGAKAAWHDVFEQCSRSQLFVQQRPGHVTLNVDCAVLGVLLETRVGNVRLAHRFESNRLLYTAGAGGRQLLGVILVALLATGLIGPACGVFSTDRNDVHSQLHRRRGVHAERSVSVPVDSDGSVVHPDLCIIVNCAIVQQKRAVEPRLDQVEPVTVPDCIQEVGMADSKLDGPEREWDCDIVRQFLGCREPASAHSGSGRTRTLTAR